MEAKSEERNERSFLPPLSPGVVPEKITNQYFKEEYR